MMERNTRLLQSYLRLNYIIFTLISSRFRSEARGRRDKVKMDETDIYLLPTGILIIIGNLKKISYEQ